MNAPLRRLAVVVFALFAALLASSTWIQFVRADELDADPRNSRTLLRELGRERGPIVVAGNAVAESVPDDDEDPYEFQRRYPEPGLYAHTTGYYSVFFGATGLESAASDLLSGTADQLFYRRVSDLLTGTEPRGAVVET
ncbi:MAG: penicillin-binding protein 2, partial [Actinomycetota bacterium]